MGQDRLSKRMVWYRPIVRHPHAIDVFQNVMLTSRLYRRISPEPRIALVFIIQGGPYPRERFRGAIHIRIIQIVHTKTERGQGLSRYPSAGNASCLWSTGHIVHLRVRVVYKGGVCVKKRELLGAFAFFMKLEV